MTIHTICDIYLRVEPGNLVTILFIPLRLDGQHERNPDGTPVCFSIPLDRDAAALAELVHGLTRWVTDRAAREMQSQQEAIQRAIAQAQPASPPPPQRRRQRPGTEEEAP